jgi:hypothetical protein
MFGNKSIMTSMFLLILCLALSILPSFAQGMCDYKEFRFETIKGRVMVKGIVKPDGSSVDEPLAQAKVELWRTAGVDNDNENDALIASTLSDENGYFEINNIKEGLYRLDASKLENGFVRNFVGIKILKKVKKSESGKQLMFRLGVEVLKPCGGGEVSLVRE